jgi:hypothetical protein
MAFWSDGALDPKRQFKFKVTFGAVSSTINAPWYIAQSADRPSYSIGDTAKVEVLDKTFYYPGKVTWNEVKIKFVDGTGAAENMARKAYTYLGSTGWVLPDNGALAAGSNLSTVGKRNSVINGILVETLNANGDKIDGYTLNNAFIKTLEQTNLDYAQDAVATVTLTLRYDWATYQSYAV